MKNDRMHELLDGVDPVLVEEAAPQPSPHVPKAIKQEKHRRILRRWIPALAAVLTVAILIGAVLGGIPGIFTPGGEDEVSTSPFGGISPQAYQLLCATYPAMAQCPTEEVNDEMMAAWQDALKARRAYRGAGKDLAPFFEQTITQILSGAGTDNMVYSPLNVYLALAMLAEVTAGESRQQILDLLGSASIEDLRTQVHAIWNANYIDDGRSVSILANSIWLNEEIDYRQDTLANLVQYYYASSFQGEMGSDGFNQALRNWMNEQTGGLLKEQIDGIEMTSATVLALASTVYFSGAWNTEFKENQITQEIFHGALGDSTWEMMHVTIGSGTYRWGDRFTAAGLGMSEGRIDFLLPDEGVSVLELLSDPQALSYIVSGDTGSNRKGMDIHMSIPKFDVESQTDLVEDMKALGVTRCFDELRADFSALATLEEPIFVNRIQHGVRVIVSEKGAKAIAYSYSDILEGSAPPQEVEEIDFTVDRPFIFVIRNADGLPLFVGVVNQING